MGLETYDPKDIEVSIAGLLITGFAQELVKVSREANIIDDEVGCQGEVARWVNNDKRGLITITLLQTSKSNLALTVLAKADEFSGTGVFPVTIRDTRGKDIHIAPQAWIRKIPDSTYKAGIETRVWELRCANLQSVIGGA